MLRCKDKTFCTAKEIIYRYKAVNLDNKFETLFSDKKGTTPSIQVEEFVKANRGKFPIEIYYNRLQHYTPTWELIDEIPMENNQ